MWGCLVLADQPVDSPWLDTPQTVRMIVNLADQYKVLLQERGFLRNAEDVAAANTFSRSWEVVKAVLCAGLYPNAIRVDSGRKRVKLFTKVCTAPGVVRAVFATVMVGNVRMSDHRAMARSHHTPAL